MGRIRNILGELGRVGAPLVALVMDDAKDDKERREIRNSALLLGGIILIGSFVAFGVGIRRYNNLARQFQKRADVNMDERLDRGELGDVYKMIGVDYDSGNLRQPTEEEMRLYLDLSK